MVPEAQLERTDEGLVAKRDGWFVLNARDSRWYHAEGRSAFCDFEGELDFPQLGFNISILEAGQSLGYYHRENGQEDFLVLSGSCVLIVEDEEQQLEAWDFVHCPPGTPHMIVGAGDGLSVVLAVGARGLSRKGLVYLPSEAARKHGVSVDEETTKPSEAYADLPKSSRVSYGGWLPEL